MRAKRRRARRCAAAAVAAAALPPLLLVLPRGAWAGPPQLLRVARLLPPRRGAAAVPAAPPPAAGGSAAAAWLRGVTVRLALRVPLPGGGTTGVAAECGQLQARRVSAVGPAEAPHRGLCADLDCVGISLDAVGVAGMCNGTANIGELRLRFSVAVTANVSADYRVTPDAGTGLPRIVDVPNCTAEARASRAAVTESVGAANVSLPMIADAVGAAVADAGGVAICGAARGSGVAMTGVVEAVGRELVKCCVPPHPVPVPPPPPPEADAIDWSRSEDVAILSYIANVWARPGAPHGVDALMDALTHGTGNATIALPPTLPPLFLPTPIANVTARLAAVTLSGLDTVDPKTWRIAETNPKYPTSLSLSARMLRLRTGVTAVLDIVPLNTTLHGPPLRGAPVTFSGGAEGASLGVVADLALRRGVMRDIFADDPRKLENAACVAPALISAAAVRVDVSATAFPGIAVSTGTPGTDAAVGAVLQLVVAAYTPRLQEILAGVSQGPLRELADAVVQDGVALLRGMAANETCRRPGATLTESASGTLSIVMIVAAVLLGSLVAGVALRRWHGTATDLDASGSDRASSWVGVERVEPSWVRAGSRAGSAPPASPPASPPSLSPGAERPGPHVSDVSRPSPRRYTIATSAGASRMTARQVRLKQSSRARAPLCAGYGAEQVGALWAALLQVALPALISGLLLARVWVMFVDYAQWKATIYGADGAVLANMPMMYLCMGTMAHDTFEGGAKITSVLFSLASYMAANVTLVGQLCVWWVPMREDTRGIVLFNMSFLRKMCMWEILFTVFISDTFHQDQGLMPESQAAAVLRMEFLPALWISISTVILGTLSHELMLHMHLSKQPLFAQRNAKAKIIKPPPKQVLDMQPRPSRRTSVFMITCMAVMMGMSGVGMFTTFYGFQITGLLGQGGEFADLASIHQTKSVVTLLHNLPTDTSKMAGIAISVFTIILVFIIPMICVSLLAALWILPLPFSLRQRCLTWVVTAWCWAGLDVFVCCVFFGIVESHGVAKWVLTEMYKVDPTLGKICKWVDGAIHDPCIDGTGTIGTGLVLIIASSGLLLFIVFATLLYEATLFEQAEAVLDEDDDALSEWSAFVYLPWHHRCLSCCRRGMVDHHADDDDEYSGEVVADRVESPRPRRPCRAPEMGGGWVGGGALDSPRRPRKASAVSAGVQPSLQSAGAGEAADFRSFADSASPQFARRGAASAAHAPPPAAAPAPAVPPPGHRAPADRPPQQCEVT